MTPYELGSIIIAILQLLALVFAAGQGWQMLRNHDTRLGSLETWKDKADPQLNRLIGAHEARVD